MEDLLLSEHDCRQIEWVFEREVDSEFEYATFVRTIMHKYHSIPPSCVFEVNWCGNRWRAHPWGQIHAVRKIARLCNAKRKIIV